MCTCSGLFVLIAAELPAHVRAKWRHGSFSACTTSSSTYTAQQRCCIGVHPDPVTLSLHVCRQAVREVDVAATGHFLEQLAAIMPDCSVGRLVRVATLSARLVQPSLAEALSVHEAQAPGRQAASRSKARKAGAQHAPRAAAQEPASDAAAATVHAHIVSAAPEDIAAGSLLERTQAAAACQHTINNAMLPRTCLQAAAAGCICRFACCADVVHWVQGCYNVGAHCVGDSVKLGKRSADGASKGPLPGLHPMLKRLSRSGIAYVKVPQPGEEMPPNLRFAASSLPVC